MLGRLAAQGEGWQAAVVAVGGWAVLDGVMYSSGQAVRSAAKEALAAFLGGAEALSWAGAQVALPTGAAAAGTAGKRCAACGAAKGPGGKLSRCAGCKQVGMRGICCGSDHVWYWHKQMTNAWAGWLACSPLASSPA